MDAWFHTLATGGELSPGQLRDLVETGFVWLSLVRCRQTGWRGWPRLTIRHSSSDRGAPVRACRLPVHASCIGCGVRQPQMLSNQRNLCSSSCGGLTRTIAGASCGTSRREVIRRVVRPPGSPGGAVSAELFRQVAKDLDSDPLFLGDLLVTPGRRVFLEEMSWLRKRVRRATASSMRAPSRSRSAARRLMCVVTSAHRS